MNIQIIFLTIAVLLIGQTCSGPIDTTAIITPEPTTTETLTTTPIIITTTETLTTTPIIITTTETLATTTTITTTVITTTTTLAPEVDREWEDLVLAGPAVVNYFSLFMVLASRADQVLTPPEGYTVKYIQNMQSLRATLSQILSGMRNALQLARDDLARTRTSMQEIPEHLKAALQLIKSATIDLLNTLLPYTLKNVERAANEGSAVTKPTLNRFVSVGLLIEELFTVLASAPSTEDNADYLIEANAYANNTKIQWMLLVDLFEKFSERADITQRSIITNFINPIDQAQQADGFTTQLQRAGELDKLVPVAIAIDQSSFLLDMMVHTYTDISTDYMENQIATSSTYLNLAVESARTISERQLWENTVSHSVDAARLALTRHNEFVETGPTREEEYAVYFDNDV